MHPRKTLARLSVVLLVAFCFVVASWGALAPAALACSLPEDWSPYAEAGGRFNDVDCVWEYDSEPNWHAPIFAAALVAALGWGGYTVRKRTLAGLQLREEPGLQLGEEQRDLAGRGLS